MKFSSVAVLAVVAPFAVGFAPIANQKSLTNVAFVKPSASQLMMSLEDLEKKATSGDLKTVDTSKGFKGGKIQAEPKPVKKAGPPKPVKAEKPKKAPKEAPKVEAPKVEMPKFEKPVEIPVTSKKAVAPKKAAKVKADQYIDVPTTKKVEKPRPNPFASKPRIQPRAPAPPPKPKAPVVVEPNALRNGVALGAAPLLLAPLVALSAGRSVLAGTKARRERIEKDIAAAEAAKLKKIKESAVDSGGLVGALAVLGVGAGALGIIVTAPFADFAVNFAGPQLSMPSVPSISRSAPSSVTWGKSSAPTPGSAIKLTKQNKQDGYDFGLTQEVKVAKKTAVKAKAAAVKEEVKVKEVDAAAEKAAEKEAKAAEAEDKALKAKQDSDAAEKKAKEAEAKAEKEASKAKTDQEKAAADSKAKDAAEKEKAAAAEKAKSDAAEKEAKAAEDKAKTAADASADKARAEEAKAAAAEKEAKAAAAKAKEAEEMAKKVKAEEAAAVKVEAPKAAPAPVAPKVETPKVEAPKVEAPKAAPAPVAPKVEAPKAAPAPVAPKAAPKAAPTPTPAPASSRKGLGVVSGSESGGKVLPKEEVSADLLNMLKARSQ